MLAAIALAVFSASGPPPAAAEPRGGRARAESLALAPGESAVVGSAGLKLVFERVESDSRCPAGARCISAGDAVVLLSLVERGHAKSRTVVRLHTHPAEVREFRHANVRVRLVSLEPRPALDREIDPAEYRASLSVAEDPGTDRQ